MREVYAVMPDGYVLPPDPAPPGYEQQDAIAAACAWVSSSHSRT
ncbi:hypothetical protein [Streptomyces sp. NPDC060031]